MIERNNRSQNYIALAIQILEIELKVFKFSSSKCDDERAPERRMGLRQWGGGEGVWLCNRGSGVAVTKGTPRRSK